MISGKHLYLSVKSAIRTLKGRRREPAAFLVAALCFSGGFALGKLLTDNWITRLQFALYAIGAIAFIYGVVRVWKLVNPPELPPAKNRPSAIKGPMAFTEADGDLFRKLERESELQKLLGLVLDNQILVIVVRGLEINDPSLAEMVRRVDDLNIPASREKIEALAEIICGGGNDSPAALLVLMATLENASDPQTLAHTVKHFAFTRCGELNLYGMVESQIAFVERKLLQTDSLVS